MAWLKDVYLDLTVLVIVILFGFFNHQILEVLLWIYTSLLLISKLLPFFMPSLNKRASKTIAPNIVYHIIYFITIAIFMTVNHFYLAGAWLIIWAASAIHTYVKKA